MVLLAVFSCQKEKGFDGKFEFSSESSPLPIAKVDTVSRKPPKQEEQNISKDKVPRFEKEKRPEQKKRSNANHRALKREFWELIQTEGVHKEYFKDLWKKYVGKGVYHTPEQKILTQIHKTRCWKNFENIWQPNFEKIISEKDITRLAKELEIKID